MPFQLQSEVLRAATARAVEMRRDFHRYPELAWTEFRTASLVARRLNKLGLHVELGRDIVDADARLGVPETRELAACYQAAHEAGADPEFLPMLEGGYTAVVGTLEGDRPGPVTALRVDMDALPINEPGDPTHIPAARGFASRRPGVMHACGHDVHTSIGLSVAEVLASHRQLLPGSVRFIFQPAEEGGRGAAPMVQAGTVDEVDNFIAIHIGLGLPPGSLRPAVDGFLASVKLDVHFSGRAAHAALRPEQGRNALLAAAQAALGLHAIAPHHAGASRVNVGLMRAGSGRNVVADTALLMAEVRGANDEVQRYMEARAQEVVRGAALAFGVQVDIQVAGRTTTARCDQELADPVAAAAATVLGLDVERTPVDMGVSEDATYFMRRVQDRGGKATYVVIGTTLAGGHHTPRFDIDEADMPPAIEALALGVLLAANRTAYERVGEGEGC